MLPSAQCATFTAPKTLDDHLSLSSLVPFTRAVIDILALLQFSTLNLAIIIQQVTLKSCKLQMHVCYGNVSTAIDT